MTSGRRRSGRAAVVLATAALMSCHDPTILEGERAAKAYCDAVILAYRTQETHHLRTITTEKEFRKLLSLIDIKTAAGLVLESTLEDLEVTGIDHPSPGVMIVSTTEQWRYFDRPVAVGKSGGPEFLVDMDLEYTFLDQDGWKMNEARTLRHDYLQPEGYSHQNKDPHGKSHGGGV